MKKYFIQFTTLVVVIWGFYYWNFAGANISEDKHSKTSNAPILSSKIFLKPNSLAKPILAKPNSNNEKRDASLDIVPWEELDSRWTEDLKDYVESLDPINGRRMLSAFYNEKNKFNKRSGEIVQQQWELLLEERTPYSEPKYKDKELNDKLNREWDQIHSIFLTNTKRIFGPYYFQIKQYSREYMKSVQGYSKEAEVPIDLEPIFMD